MFMMIIMMMMIYAIEHVYILQSAVELIHVLVLYLNALRFDVSSRHEMLSQWIYYSDCAKKHTYWLTKKSTHSNTHTQKNNLLYGCIEYTYHDHS